MKSIIEMFNNLFFHCDYDQYDEMPNGDCIDKVIEVSKVLCEKYKIEPIRILPFIAGGITIFYEENNIELIVEVYNDLDIAALVNDNNAKSIITSEDIVDFNFCNIVKIFKERVDEKETN